MQHEECHVFHPWNFSQHLIVFRTVPCCRCWLGLLVCLHFREEWLRLCSETPVSTGMNSPGEQWHTSKNACSCTRSTSSCKGSLLCPKARHKPVLTYINTSFQPCSKPALLCHGREICIVQIMFKSLLVFCQSVLQDLSMIFQGLWLV